MKDAAFSELMARSLEGELPIEELEILVTRSAEDPTLRNALFRERAIDHDLRRLLSPSSSDDAFMRGTLSALESGRVSERTFTDEVVRRGVSSVRGVAILRRAVIAVAAVVVAASVTHRMYFTESPAERIATVVSPARSAYVERNGIQIPLANGDGVYSHDVVNSTIGSLTLHFNDRTELRMSAETTCSFERGERGELAVRVERGRIAAAVSPQDATARFFSDHASAEVLGTRLAFGVSRDATRLAVLEGLVRFTASGDDESIRVSSGQYAIAAEGTDLVARSIAPPPRPARVQLADTDATAEWTELFARDTLSGWRQHWGTWSVNDGVIAGTGNAAGRNRGRIESDRHYGAFEMECDIKLVGGSTMAEFQVGSYAYFCQFDLRGQETKWHRLHAEVRHGRLSATLDGTEILAEIGTGWEMGSTGPIAFFVSRGGSIEMRAARIRELEE